MADFIETGLYLLTPTHVGKGQAAGAIDLPITREQHTAHPYLPSTALKGVARDLAERNLSKGQIERLFGSDPPQPGRSAGPLKPGDLVFGDGRLLAFPVRTLDDAFAWVTSPLIIERWRRVLTARGLAAPKSTPALDRPTATFSARDPFVLEDHLLPAGALAGADPALVEIARAWSRLLPAEEPDLAARFRRRLVCLPDADLGYLLRRCTPVQARVQLTPGKTTDTWTDPDSGEEYTGNLWYEESLPTDCLFSVVIGARDPKQAGATSELGSLLGDGAVVQVGGNATVGFGLCRWRQAGGPHDQR